MAKKEKLVLFMATIALIALTFLSHYLLNREKDNLFLETQQKEMVEF